MALHPKAITPCKHEFHTACLARAFKEKAQCPMCRLFIKREQMQEIVADANQFAFAYKVKHFKGSQKGSSYSRTAQVPVLTYNDVNFIMQRMQRKESVPYSDALNVLFNILRFPLVHNRGFLRFLEEYFAERGQTVTAV